MTIEYTLEALTQKLEAIKGQWHLGTHQGNDGNPGNTLESLLGLPENNLRLPDFGEIEIKAKILDRKSLHTLFHKEPMPAASTPKLIRCFGWKHTKAGQGKYAVDEMSFRSTTGMLKPTARGFKIEIEPTRIVFTYDKSKVVRTRKDQAKIYANLGLWADDVEQRMPHYSSILPVYWDKEEFIANCITKLDQTLVCYCKRKKENGLDYYQYLEAYIYSGFLREKIESFGHGLVLDFDARTGKNHGIKLRAKKKLLPELFARVKKVM